jgi:hypothetical protein
MAVSPVKDPVEAAAIVNWLAERAVLKEWLSAKLDVNPYTPALILLLLALMYI